jgi:hypothetical protein
MVWEALTTIAVPANAATVTGGTVTVLAVRPEEQKGGSRDPKPLCPPLNF